MATDPAAERRALTLFEAALDVPEAERGAWIDAATTDDLQVRARARAMLDADRLASLRTGGALDGLDDEPMPVRVGPYRIVRLIGRGGMGAVYLGERDAGDFDRTVAIKLIKAGLLSDRLVERFVAERQTLAGLQHPHIARLYDGGTTEGGAPYIVMEYVDGQPILDWSDSARDRDARLRLFGDVCAAISYAHGNLVVHRDITPSNVLVTEDGTAKLIDFGIARPAGYLAEEPTSRRSLASLTLTPGYAAPERMAGGEATIAADIYSLGKLLDALLDGPRDGELDAIVARATAAEPADRYATADALRADIDARLRDLPVKAMPPRRRYLADKFVRRHRLGVGASVLAVVALLTALGGTVWALGQARVAQAEAEQRFAQTRGIANALLFGVYDEVSKVSGATNARVTLAKTGLAYLDALAADADAPRDVRLEVGRGYLRLAKVTGDGQMGQLGKYEDANALLAKATSILKPLHEAAPDDPVAAREYAALLIELAVTNIYNNSKPALARTQGQEAQRLLAPLQPFDAVTASRYARALQVEGDSLLWENQFEAARVVLQRTETFLTGLPPEIARSTDVMQSRRSTLRYLGEALHELKQVEPARLVLDRNVAVARDLVKADPSNPMFVRNLALGLRYAAIVHRTNKRNSAARVAITESVAIARGLLDRNPGDAGASNVFVVTAEVLAQVLGDAGQYPQSYDLGAQVYAAQQAAVAKAGNTPGALRSMATSTATRGENHYNGGDYAGACRWWRDALNIFARLEARGALTEYDRGNGVPSLRKNLKLGCENGPPRRLDGGVKI